MISSEDCMALCGSTREEVLAVAEREHIPEIAATDVAQYLLQLGRGDRPREQTLLHVLHHYLKAHPDARRGL